MFSSQTRKLPIHLHPPSLNEVLGSSWSSGGSGSSPRPTILFCTYSIQHAYHMARELLLSWDSHSILPPWSPLTFPPFKNWPTIADSWPANSKKGKSLSKPLRSVYKFLLLEYYIWNALLHNKGRKIERSNNSSPLLEIIIISRFHSFMEGRTKECI